MEKSFYSRLVLPVSISTPVSDLLRIYLPGLWAYLLLQLYYRFGKFIGRHSWIFPKTLVKSLDSIIMVIRPIPHYVFGILVLILFAYVWPLFPVGGIVLGRRTTLNLDFVLRVLHYSFLPAFTLVIIGGTSWFQQMKLLVQNVKREDFIQYAQAGGVKERFIISRYVLPNAMLPQITQLTLALGQVFSGVLIVEMVFSYPGMGLLLYRGVTRVITIW